MKFARILFGSQILSHHFRTTFCNTFDKHRPLSADLLKATCHSSQYSQKQASNRPPSNSLSTVPTQSRFSILPSMMIDVLHQGCVVTLDGISYYVRGKVELTLSGDRSEEWMPAVVLNVVESRLTREHVIETFESFSKDDDVFGPSFHKGLIILQTPAKVDVFSIPAGLNVYSKEANSHQADIPEGPYFVRGNSVHQAWRLYADHLSAFLTTTIPDDVVPYKFHPLHAAGYDGLYPVVAVPSRLYFPKSAAKPLNGKRITVKDNFHLDGMVTTLGNRAFAQYYGVQNVTSEYLKHLIDLGAIIIGKTKLSSFAGTEVPPRGPIDYFPPFNARADGYQGPQGSSGGAGAASGGYDWIDASICTDTTGSCRGPAQINGVWGMRTTWGSTSMEGIVPSAQNFDTVGIMTRTPDEMQVLVDSSVKTQVIDVKAPMKLIYPSDWLPTNDPEQMAMIESFVEALEISLGVSRTEISLSKEWSLTGPEELRETPLQDYLKRTGLSVNMYLGYQNFNSFRDGYKRKFGVKPYTSPVQSSKWERGSQFTKEMFDEGLSQIETLKTWLGSHVMSVEGNGTNPAMMVVDVGLSDPLYRDRDPEPGAGGVAGSYNGNFFPTILGLPQIVVPIGQKPYMSKITDRTEYSPIVAGIVSTQGMDSMLVEIAKAALVKAGWPTTVKIGSLMFDLGDNNRHASLAVES